MIITSYCPKKIVLTWRKDDWGLPCGMLSTIIQRGDNELDDRRMSNRGFHKCRQIKKIDKFIQEFVIYDYE